LPENAGGGLMVARGLEVNAVNRLLTLAMIALVLSTAPQISAAQLNEDIAQTNFQAVIDDLNNNSFKSFRAAIDKNALLGRVVGAYLIEPEIRDQLSDKFDEWVQEMFIASFPPSKAEIIGTIVAYEGFGDTARALVRYESSGYRFAYHVYELTVASNGSIGIVDWTDYYQGGLFSQEAAESFVRTLPTQQATRQLLENKNVDEGRLFQVSELFKSVRDNAHPRFFSIYDAMDEELRSERVVVRLNLYMTSTWDDRARRGRAVESVAANFPDDPLFSQPLIEFDISMSLFERAITELGTLQNGLGVVDGATETLKATAAMALGEMERAEEYALSATQAEPDLELAWWSLLRVRTAAGDYAGATEAMTQLEDRFEYLLIPQKLRRDRFLKVLIEQQEYKDWRAARDEA
jgi:tetratricopeptide (TPR) repeat protein